MSLKHFHLVFLFFAVLCDSGFWLWTVLSPDQAAKLGVAGIGRFAGLLSLVLIGYGIWYVARKMKKIII
ncbi:MAG: hypothetical protein KDK97_00750 [Verrucomicrobiales bacterium]|nr:hypothetical protein [Verrucomicrobiales bacterium]MCP5557873.1 hypothetical protein [Verrucomicrobiaceae bacterium]